MNRGRHFKADVNICLHWSRVNICFCIAVRHVYMHNKKYVYMKNIKYLIKICFIETPVKKITCTTIALL